MLRVLCFTILAVIMLTLLQPGLGKKSTACRNSGSSLLSFTCNASDGLVTIIAGITAKSNSACTSSIRCVTNMTTTDLQTLQRGCTGQQSCGVSIDFYTNGSCGTGTYNYQEVTYTCMSTKYSTTDTYIGTTTITPAHRTRLITAIVIGTLVLLGEIAAVIACFAYHKRMRNSIGTKQVDKIRPQRPFPLEDIPNTYEHVKQDGVYQNDQESTNQYAAIDIEPISVE